MQKADMYMEWEESEGGGVCGYIYRAIDGRILW